MPTELKSTDRASQIASGYRLIADAAGLMRRCAGYMTDQQAEQDGWKVFYAVDVDVIAMYMAPSQNSRYAAVFSNGEDTDTRGLLARLLGDFIFRQLGSDGEQGIGSLFIIPPHDEELGRMIFALSNKLVDAIDEAEILLENVLADLPERLANGDYAELSQWLIDDASALVEIFDGKSGPRSELDRFEALDEHRLLHVERYKEEPGSWTFPLPQLKGNSQDFESFTTSFDAWKKRLLKYKGPRQPHYAHIGDAYAMAMVEWVNQHMEAGKRRLVFITGTQGILKAASDYCPAVIKGHSKSFAELYIRHPQAFMADNGFFPEVPAQDEKGGTRNFSLFDWLNLFFPKVIRDGVKRVATVNTTLLKRIESDVDQEFQEAIVLLAKSEHSDEKRAGFPESMLDEWRTQIRSACVSREINTAEANWPRRAKELLEWLKSRLDQGWTVEQLRSDLANRAIQSMSALYSSTVWLGLWSQVGTNLEQIRGIPALRFDPGYEPAQKYCRLLIAAMKAGNDKNPPDQPQYLDIADMYSQLSGVDKSNYHGHVIHALAYATKGHWYAAKTLCKIALRTVDDLPKDDEKEYRRGREAAYLLTISERRLAHNVADLVVAREYLQDAQSTRENPGASFDLRFLSEAIAIDVAKINFEYFTNEGTSTTPAEFNRIWQDASELFSILASEPQPECRSWICQQLSTNILNLALIYYHANRCLPDATPKLVQEVLSGLTVNRLNQESMEFNDTVSEFVYLTATAVFCADAAEKTQALNKLKEFKFHASLPFDKTREKMFLKLVDQIQQSSC